MASHRFSCTQYFPGLAFLCSNIYLPWGHPSLRALTPSCTFAGGGTAQEVGEPQAAEGRGQEGQGEEGGQEGARQGPRLQVRTVRGGPNLDL